MTLGERKVRVQFNPSKDSLVEQIKQKTAELINLVNEHNYTLVGEYGTSEDLQFQNSELPRLKSLAMTHYETAAMFAVKMATV